MGYSDKLIGRYKHLRSMRELDKVYACKYALVGFGSHCTANLLPAIQHLQLPLKYVCCTSERKAALISRKYGGIKGTTSLQDLLNDKSIAGIFVATRPQFHFQIASEIIKTGKALFIEKPPCETENELNALTDSAKLYGPAAVVVGLQRRFAPATQILLKRLKSEYTHHYHYRYLTGHYPEGDALLELFIHPLDYVTFLFGKAKVKSAETIACKGGGQTLFLILEHRGVTGMLELSTAYSWQYAQERLSINTNKGHYVLDRTEQLNFIPCSSSVFGVPMEKVFRRNTPVVSLYGRNGFVPTISNNQLVSQGFLSEIETFADCVEGRSEANNAFGLESIRLVYALMAEIRAYTGKERKRFTFI